MIGLVISVGLFVWLVQTIVEARRDTGLLVEQRRRGGARR